jgi:hypothetical protein
LEEVQGPGKNQILKEANREKPLPGMAYRSVYTWTAKGIPVYSTENKGHFSESALIGVRHIAHAKERFFLCY